MTFSEQVKLFAETEIVVAPHGAGLTNIMFCPEKTVVVELFGPPHYIRPDYFQLAHNLGLQYEYLLCIYQEYDLQVDINSLSQILRRYGVAS
jgi:capsular polysaccharide biosynthesis protein